MNYQNKKSMAINTYTLPHNITRVVLPSLVIKQNRIYYVNIV